MSPLVAVGVVVATMALAVVATMVVENWHHLVQRVPLRPPAGPDAVAPVAVPTAEPGPAPLPAGIESHQEPEPEPQPPGPPGLPPSGLPDGAVSLRPGAVVLRDPDTARVLAGLLFAAYATRRTSGADRAAAWVTAAACPPGAPPARFPAGVDLRGRPGRVDELLAHDEGGGTWVTLQPRVDIARGVARTPVRQRALAGLVTWWSHSCAGPGVMEPDAVLDARDAVAAVRPRLDDTPWAAPVDLLHAALRDAAATGAGLLVDVARGPAAPSSGGGAAGQGAGHRARPDDGPGDGQPRVGSAGSAGSS